MRTRRIRLWLVAASLLSSTNKIQIGVRTASGWSVLVQSPRHLNADTDYAVTVIVNGLTVTVYVNGRAELSYSFQPRWIEGEAFGFNLGLVGVGVGSDNSRGSFDDVSVKVLPPQEAFESTEDYEDGVADLATGDRTGTWAVADGRFGGSASDSERAIAIPDTDYRLMIALSGTGVIVSLDGTELGSFAFYAPLLDGKLGLIGPTGSSSFDDTRAMIGWRIQTAIDPLPPTLTIPANVARSTGPGQATALVSDAAIGSATATDT